MYSIILPVCDKVEKELNCLVTKCTVEPVEIAEQAAQIVVVIKPDKNNVHICEEYKQTVKPVSTLDM